MVPFAQLFDPGSINDEGLIGMGAARLWFGDALYTDFTTHIAPGLYLLTLICFYLFGPNILAVRVLMALITGGLVLTVYLVSKRVVPGPYRFIAPGLFLCAGVTQWPILSYHWAGVLAFMVGVVALLAWNEKPTKFSAGACGGSFAFSCWMLQSEAAALLFLTALATLDRRKEMSRQDFLYWFLGFGAVSGLLWTPIFWRTSVWDVWEQNVLWAIQFNAVPGSAPYDVAAITTRWSGFWQPFSRAPWTAAVVWWAVQSVSFLLVWSINYLAFYPVLLLSTAVGWKYREERAFRLVIYGQLASCLAWQSRQTMLYLNFVTPLFLILLVYLGYRARKAGKVLLGLVGLSYLCAYGFWCREAGQYTFPIRTPRGTLYAKNPNLAGMMDRVYRVAEELTPPGSPAFCYPYAMGFGFLSGVRPVTRLLYIIPILGPDHLVPKVLEDLEQSKPPYIYYSPWGRDTLHAVPRVDQARFWSLMEDYNSRIQADYEPVAKVENIQFLKRRKEP